MKELRLGVIGCTNRGTLADNAHKVEEGVRIVAGADIYPDARELFLKRYEENFQCKPNVYADYREMIEKEDLDGVFITAPDFLHEEMGVFALEHKVPVYMEKPLAITLEGADRILEAAYRNRTKLVVGHNMRYMDFTRKMKALIDAGEIGDVMSITMTQYWNQTTLYTDWRTQTAVSGGGITVSGGEPLLQGERFLHFLNLCHIHKAVETCGFAPEDIFCKMLEKTDYVMLDIKLADPALHRKYTGAANDLILKNLDNLRQSGKPFVLRTPLIPGITDTEDNLAAVREIVKDDPWERLPYNPLTESKYERIGREFSL